VLAPDLPPIGGFIHSPEFDIAADRLPVTFHQGPKMSLTLMKTLLIGTLAASVVPALSAAPTPSLECHENGWHVNGLETFCKMVEIPALFGGSLSVTTTNGSITIRAWDGPDMLVRAQINTAAATIFDAESLAAQVSIDVSDGRVQASGPQNTMYRNWSLNYEIFLPHTADLSLTTANGALSITDVQGRIQFNVANGAVALVRLAGQVDGKISNGALAITLGGDHWDGAGLDVKTANGAITINTPYDYSAHFDASTTVGTVSTKYPVAVQTRNGKWGIPGLSGSLTFDAGIGGAPIRVSRVVGTIRIQRASE